MSYKISDRQNNLVCKLKIGRTYKISELETLTAGDLSLSTLKRDLQALVKAGFVTLSGERKMATYEITPSGILHRNFDSRYLALPDDRRGASATYNFEAFSYLEQSELFSKEEQVVLSSATDIFYTKGRTKNDTIYRRELERFVIELSWKSSRIEGNTYTLLDTELLIRDGISSKTNTRDEAIMILNHKAVFSYILELKELGKNIYTVRELENIHRLLVEGLGIDHGLRSSAVGIIGTVYTPLAYTAQIETELKKLVTALTMITNPYARSLAAVLGIAYLQPFSDGNKRTARLFKCRTSAGKSRATFLPHG
jgi:Fic family protein